MDGLTGFEANDPRAFCVRTRSGTLYEISAPDTKGARKIKRQPGGLEKGKTFISSHEELETGIQSVRKITRPEFLGRLRAPVSIGSSLYFEIIGEDRSIVSEPVDEIDEISQEEEKKDAATEN